MYKKCLANRITRNELDYKCYLCHYQMKQSRFYIVDEHLLSVNHQEKLNQIDKEKRDKELDQLLELTGPERKSIVENLITFDRTSFNLNCHVCKCKINGLSNTLQHINGYAHKKNLKNFIEQNYKAEQKPKACDRIIVNKTAVEKSVSVQPLISTLHLGSNGITYNQYDNFYYCNVCKIKIIDIPNVSQHTQGLLHQVLESKLKNPTLTSKLDYIIYNKESHSYQCTICKCKLMSEKNVSQHIHGFQHLTMLGSQKASKVSIVDSANQMVLNPQQVQQVNKIDSKKKDEVLEQTDFKSHFTEMGFCKTCHAFIGSSSILQCHIILHLYKEFHSLRNSDLIKFELKTDKKFYLECLLCNVFVCESPIINADQELEKHFETDMHLARLDLFNYSKSDVLVPPMGDQIISINLESAIFTPKTNVSLESFCNACKVPVFLNNQKEHASGKNHNKNVSENATSNRKVVKTAKSSSKKNLDYYACFVCEMSFSESSNWLKHLKTVEHQWKIITLNMINRSSYIQFAGSKKFALIKCFSCKVKMHDFKTAINHLLGKRHNEELKFLPVDLQSNSNSALLGQVANEFEKLCISSKDLSKTYENSLNSAKNKNVAIIKTKSIQKIKEEKKFETGVEELNQLGFDMENILPLELDTVNKALDNLVQLGFNDSQIKRLPSLAKPKTRRTPKVEDHRRSFAANVLLNGKTFVKYCIDPGLENIYNPDDEKISLSKIGVTLTFPYYSDRVCIPCGEQFPDNVQSLFEHLKKQKHLEITCDMLIDDEGFENFPEQFSDLKLAKLYMHTSDPSIECRACDIRIEDKDNIIRQHAEDPAHKERSILWKEESDQLFNQYSTIYKDIWYYAEVFFCEVCKKRYEFEIDFAMHLIHPEHMKKVYELKHKGINVTFDLCPSCITYWFGKTDSYELHCQSNFHKRLATNKDFMVHNFTIIASEYLDDIDKNIELLVSESDKVNLEKDKEKELLEAIVETVKPTYPDAQAYIFGSRLSDLGFPDSDADVFLDCGNVYYISSTKEQSQQYINSVKSHFNDSPGTWVTYEVLLETRIPIMKLKHIPTDLKCDISFTNGLSVEKSQLIGLYNGAFPICRKLILFMKKWLTLCRIFGSDYITTFAISWCIIFYLQLQGILPSVDELIKRKMESKIVDGWECGYERMITAESSRLSFKDHLKGFFTYFANFDYQKNVICPYLGKTIDKRAFAYTEELPAEMDIYKRRLKNNEVEIFRFDSPMCIQDPIDLSQNLTKAVKKQQLRCFRHYCMLSAAKC